jgi:hypothetical protein
LCSWRLYDRPDIRIKNKKRGASQLMAGPLH